MTSAQDLRELNADDLRNRERDLYDQLFRLRVQKAMGQLDAPIKIRQVRRDLGADELGTKARDLTDQLFRLRIQKSMGQLEAPLKVRAVRRQLARVKTLLGRKA